MIPRVLVVIPAFNEADSIGRVISEVQKHTPESDIVVVDDGSSDKTADIARAGGATVLELPFNLGVGGAMRLGFKYALLNKYSAMVQVDADGQHDPKSIPALVSALRDSDIVIGARFAGIGDYSVTGPRSWAMRFLSKALSKICSARLTDTTSGFRASNVNAIRLFSSNYPAEYLGDTIESLVIAARSGLRISQVPVAMRERAGGEPSQRPTQAAIHLVRACAAICFSLLRPSVPFSSKEGR